MGKIYLKKNVLEAFDERINFVFDEFDLVYFSVSGGKDSSVMVQMANRIAKNKKKTFDVFFMDLEAQYKSTIEHIKELKKLSQIRDFYHLCLPVNLSNACSVFQTHWKCWDRNEKKKWVRDMSPDSINIENHPFGDLFNEGEEFESWMVKFPIWLKEKHKSEKIAGVIGIRADESFNRFRSIAFGKSKYKNKCWSNKFRKGCYNFYPIYDWRTEDIWGAVSRFNLSFNQTYELLYKNGVSIHQQRICQPFGSDQRVSLNQWARLEPETWHKIVERVSGANYGNIYCKTSLLGHNKTEKPDHLTWQQYTVFLLESLGLYSPKLVRHYIRKIKIYFEYYYDNHNIGIKDIPDELTPQEIKEMEGGEDCNNWIHWKRIARTIEKNDFACHMLSYGLTKTDKEEIRELKQEWGKDLGIQTNNKDLRLFKEELKNED